MSYRPIGGVGISCGRPFVDYHAVGNLAEYAQDEKDWLGMRGTASTTPPDGAGLRTINAVCEILKFRLALRRIRMY